MNRKLRWKVYFWDEITQQVVTRTNIQTEIITVETELGERQVFDFPQLPVILCVNILYDQPSPRGVVVHDRNYYCLNDMVEWSPVTLSGLLNYLDFNRGSACVLRGVAVGNQRFWETHDYAMKHDPEIHRVVSKIKAMKKDGD